MPGEAIKFEAMLLTAFFLASSIAVGQLANPVSLCCTGQA